MPDTHVIREVSLIQSDPDPQWGREWNKAKGLLAGFTKNVDWYHSPAFPRSAPVISAALELS